MNTLASFYQNLGLALSLLVIATFLLAGLVKGIIGLGLPTIAMGLLGLAMAPSQAAALLSSLPGGLRADVSQRMASLDQTSPETINRISAVVITWKVPSGVTAL